MDSFLNSGGHLNTEFFEIRLFKQRLCLLFHKVKGSGSKLKFSSLFQPLKPFFPGFKEAW